MPPVLDTISMKPNLDLLTNIRGKSRQAFDKLFKASTIIHADSLRQTQLVDSAA